MHEFGLAEHTLALALDQARRRNARRIHAINMQIGALSGVVVEAFEFAFSALSEGTIAEGARLSVETTPILCYCPSCGMEFEARDFQYACPRCRSTDGEIRQGREMNLVSLEVS